MLLRYINPFPGAISEHMYISKRSITRSSNGLKEFAILDYYEMEGRVFSKLFKHI
jgi:hypothetical protein